VRHLAVCDPFFWLQSNDAKLSIDEGGIFCEAELSAVCGTHTCLATRDVAHIQKRAKWAKSGKQTPALKINTPFDAP
jgi:hypothetical protein